MVQVERAAGVVTITFDNPPKKNALSSQAWEDLRDICREVQARSREDRVVVVTGAEGNFSSGQDLWAGSDGEPPHQLTAMREINAGRESLFVHPKYIELLTGDENVWVYYAGVETETVLED